MPDKCFVPGCKNNYATNTLNVSSFHPRKEQLEEWRKAIPRSDKVLTCKDVVCENHFREDKIISKTRITLPDGSVYEEERRRKALKDGAVPTIFEGICQGVKIPKYLSNRKSSRKSPIKRYGEAKGVRQAPLVASVATFTKQLHPVVESLKLKSLPTLLNDALRKAASLPLPPNWKCIEDVESISFVHSPSGDLFNIDRSLTFRKEQNQQTQSGPSHQPQKENPPETQNTQNAPDREEKKNPVEVKFKGKEIKICKNLATEGDLLQFIKEINSLRPCPGSSDTTRHEKCAQVLPLRVISKSVRCKFCQRERKKNLKASGNKVKQALKKKKKEKRKCDKIYRMRKKILSLREEILVFKNQIRDLEGEAVQKVLNSISEEKHKTVVKAIIMAAQCKHPNTRRYANEWMYECILMRIKSAALYRKMLRDKLLPLPCLKTIQRFIKKLRPQFGFHEPTFKLMAEKAKLLPESERHGTLMVDEMAMEENIVFDKVSGQVHGMMDLGSASPPGAGFVLGDHALVFAFEPFKGQWFQSLGAFCTKGAAKGPELEKLTNECVMLLAKHKYYVDVVTSDGGSWNRNMWGLNGITEHQVSCLNPAAAGDEQDPAPAGHNPGPAPVEPARGLSLNNAASADPAPTDASVAPDKSPPDSDNPPRGRRLWFMSDFPHLVKSVWSRVRTAKELQTPEGTVKLEHWKVLADADNQKHTHINICHQLSHDHIDPSNWQSMNVKMAFQFFDEDVAMAMEYYRDVEKVPELKDCDATCAFIRRMYRLRKAMNARNSWDSLRYDPTNEAYKAINEFLAYLDLWKEKVPAAGSRLAWQTELGLKVSLKGTLELCKYLTEELGFEYLMTSRLNQDPLEHLFGKLRQACGANQHPDPQQFIQVYRLLSVASLIKPPRGSNVTGGEMLATLTSLTDIIQEENEERRQKLEAELDRILDQGDEDGIVESHFFNSDKYLETAPGPAESEHEYNMNTKINPYAFQLFGGYVARKARNLGMSKRCKDCFHCLTKCSEDVVPTQSLIDKKSRGFLLKPSQQLYNFLVKVENVILTTLSKCKMNRNILLDVVERLESSGIHSEVGCDAHKRATTKEVLVWYLNTRMIFATKRFMKVETAAKKKKRKAKSLMKTIKLNALQVQKEAASETKANGKKNSNKPKVVPDQHKDGSVLLNHEVEVQAVLMEPPQAEPQPPAHKCSKGGQKRKATELLGPTPAKRMKATGKSDSTPCSTKAPAKKKLKINDTPAAGKSSKTQEATPTVSRSGRSRKVNGRYADYQYY